MLKFTIVETLATHRKTKTNKTKERKQRGGVPVYLNLYNIVN